jgi:hypothetical protein
VENRLGSGARVVDDVTAAADVDEDEALFAAAAVFGLLYELPLPIWKNLDSLGGASSREERDAVAVVVRVEDFFRRGML